MVFEGKNFLVIKKSFCFLNEAHLYVKLVRCTLDASNSS